MTHPHDSQGDMERFTIDTDSADRLLRGALSPEDAPHRYGEVAALLQAAVVPTTGSLDGEAAAVTAIVDAIRSAPAPGVPAPRRTRLTKTKVAAASVAGFLSLTTGLAAANALPGPVQRAASDALSTVGVNVPHGKHGNHPNGGKSAEHRNDGHEANDSTADAGTPPSTAPGSEISNLARNTEPGPDHGAVVSNEASNGKSQAGEPHGTATPPVTGPPTSTPAANRPTPDPGGSTHSEGTTTADDHRNDAATVGQGNAGGRKP